MKTLALVVLALPLMAAAPRDPWPDTPAGSMARKYIEAFSKEAAMREYLLRNVAEDELRKRSIDERMSSYREAKKKFGTLRFGSIVLSRPDKLKVVLLDSDDKKLSYTFTLQPAPPHKLLSITREERHHGLGLFPGH